MRITPIMNAPTSALPTWPRPPAKAGAADDHGRDRVELGEIAEVGRAGRGAAGGDDGGRARRQAAQHVDGDEHPVDAGCRSAGAPPGCRRPRRSSAPRPSCARSTAASAASAATTNAECGNQPMRLAADVDRPTAGMPELRAAVREQERQPARDAERGERDDERMRDAAVDEDEPVDGPRRRAPSRASRAIDQRRRRGRRWKTSAPTTVARASVRPTERSMPRVRITSSWPIASTAMTAVASRTLPMLPVVMNKGVDRLAASDDRGEHQRRTRPQRPQESGQARGTRCPGPAARPGGYRAGRLDRSLGRRGQRFRALTRAETPRLKHRIIYTILRCIASVTARPSARPARISASSARPSRPRRCAARSRRCSRGSARLPRPAGGRAWPGH